ncbi:hypothetical protein ACIQGO_11945 [Streptomyces shenzhenensis]|uniref:hypothetical protein n=1 Tax=Streptomyces shenzhenensis TaxID=943815 RepID=UPI0038087616
MVPDGAARWHAASGTVPLGEPAPADTTVADAPAGNSPYDAGDTDEDTRRHAAGADALAGAHPDGDSPAARATDPPAGAPPDDSSSAGRTDIPGTTDTEPAHDAHPLGTALAADTGTAVTDTHEADADTDGGTGIRATAAIDTCAVPDTGTDADAEPLGTCAGPRTHTHPHTPADTHPHDHTHTHTTATVDTYAVAHPGTDGRPQRGGHHDMVHVPHRGGRGSADGRRPDGR